MDVHWTSVGWMFDRNLIDFDKFSFDICSLDHRWIPDGCSLNVRRMDLPSMLRSASILKFSLDVRRIGFRNMFVGSGEMFDG